MKTWINRVIVVAILVFDLGEVQAQTTSELLRATQTKNYFAPRPVVGTLDSIFFEGQIGNSIYFPLKEDARLAFWVDANVILRMILKESFPVQNPSYRVGTRTLYQVGDQQASFKKFFQLNFTHHSNGRTGHFLKDSILNYDNGNFTTNFLDVGMRFYSQPKNGWHLMQQYSFNYDIDLTGDVHFRNNYSNQRVSARLELFNYLYTRDTLRKSSHFELNFSLLLDRDELNMVEQSWIASSIRYTYRPIPKWNLGAFVELYAGEDYYNVHFAKGPMWFCRVGLLTLPLRIGPVQTKV